MNFDAMLDEYYEESGFDKKTGWPTKATLDEVGLQDVASELYSR
jgi:aldehyde:ferredoxin oxidoreductase